MSGDDVKIQKQFEEKNGLKVRLLSDTGKKVLEEYGVLGGKKWFGRTAKGTTRSTFLIDPRGILAKVWRNVKVQGHAEEVLHSLVELSGKVPTGR